MPRIFTFIVSLICIVTLVCVVSAQSSAIYKRPTEGLLLPVPSITETRDATALAINPSNMAFLDGWSFVYLGSWLRNQAHVAGQGHGFFFAFPVGMLSLGTAIEALTPSEKIQHWQGMDARIRFSLGMALNFRRAVAIGMAYRTFWYYATGQINTLDLGLTVHPMNHLALSFVAADITAPEIRHSGSERAPRRFKVGLTLRPFANDRLALGAELNYLYGDPLLRTDAAALLSVMLIDGVVVRGQFRAEGIRDNTYPAGYFIDAAIEIDLPSFGIGTSMHGQINPSDRAAYHGTTWSARFSGDEAPHVRFPRAIRAPYAAAIEIDEPLDTYSTAGLMQLFERIQQDDTVDMVILKPNAGTISLSQAQEIRRGIRGLQQANRSVVCYLVDATASVYLTCAGANQIWLNPAGGIRLAGIFQRQIFYRDLFEKIGVKADIVRIGEYKSTPEAYTQTTPSKASEYQLNRYLDSVYDHIAANFSVDRKLDNLPTAKRLIEQGPFTAKEALGKGLVDRIVPADILDRELEQYAGGALYINRHYGRDKQRARRYLNAPAVAVIHIDGQLVDGENVDVPLLDVKMSGAKTLVGIIRQVRDDRQIQAVVLRIDSPGGSALASDLVWREIMALRRAKPVIASMGSVAASGAYYIASAANEIYAETTTLTGSIGIFYGKADLSGLLDKIGINVVTYKRGPHADAQSWARPYTPEERQRLLQQIGEYYDLFKNRVVAGRSRGFTSAIVDKLGRGRIWSGAEAQGRLLVDKIGGYAQALNRARELGSIPRDVPVFHYPKPGSNLFSRFVKSIAAMARQPSPLDHLFSTRGMRQILSAMVPFASLDPELPRAVLPFAIDVDE